MKLMTVRGTSCLVHIRTNKYSLVKHLKSFEYSFPNQECQCQSNSNSSHDCLKQNISCLKKRRSSHITEDFHSN